MTSSTESGRAARAVLEQAQTKAKRLAAISAWANRRRLGVLMLRLASPNGELERPSAEFDRAPCAHNRPGAQGAALHLSRPLQHLVRRPPHRSPLCARGNLRAIKAASLKVKRATLRFEPDQGCLRFAHLAISDTNQSHAGARPEPTYTDTVPTKAAVSLQDLGRNIKLLAARALYFAGANLPVFESRHRCNPRDVNRSGSEPASFNSSRVASSLRTSNGEVEGPPRSARSSAAGAQCLPRPRRVTTHRSRTPPTIVRRPHLPLVRAPRQILLRLRAPPWLG